MLLAAKKVEVAREEVALAAPPASLIAKLEGDDMPALRRKYHDKFGKRPWMAWNAETLREKLAADAV